MENNNILQGGFGTCFNIVHLKISREGGSSNLQGWDADKTKLGKKVIKVFRAWSTKVPGMIASGEIKVQHTARSG